MKKSILILVLLPASLALGGCQSIFGGRLFASAKAESVDLSDYFSARLEAGRQHMRSDRPAQAAIAFRQASYDPGHAAESYNGMAIAYAAMGRKDLAEIHFMKAIEADPSDARFIRNLARLDSKEDPIVANASDAATHFRDNAAVSQLPQELQQLAPESPVRVEGRGAGLMRVSDKEVRIAAAKSVGGAQPNPTSDVRGQIQAHRPAARASLGVKADAPYPVRISLKSVRTVSATSDRRANSVQIRDGAGSLAP